jgi:hypothetical protein
MKLNSQDLDKIASLTLDHYNQRAEEFWQSTRDHDVKQNIAALYNGLRVNRLLQSWILAADLVATSRCFLNSVT